MGKSFRSFGEMIQPFPGNDSAVLTIACLFRVRHARFVLFGGLARGLHMSGGSFRNGD
jgi:hypothetical protein